MEKLEVILAVCLVLHFVVGILDSLEGSNREAASEIIRLLIVSTIIVALSMLFYNIVDFIFNTTEYLWMS